MSGGGEDAGLETLDDMMQRHRKEVKELQSKEMEMKKAAAKGSKAEQKAKKKQVEETVAKLEAEIKTRHASELAALKVKESQAGATQAEPASTEAGDGASEVAGELQGLRLYAQSAERQVSKAQKRRSKKAAQEAERERRITEEQSNVVSDRVVEDAALAEQLRPLGLTVVEVKPDGHCLFRAIEDQLGRSHPGDGAPPSGAAPCPHPLGYLELRRLAADHMRAHAADFMAFVEAEGEADEGLDPVARLEEYCHKVESTAAWGGQLELQALAQKLQRKIVVYCAGKPNVEVLPQGLGEGQDVPSIRLSYHQHAFGLGEHYNSVVDLVTSTTNEPVAQEEEEEK